MDTSARHLYASASYDRYAKPPSYAVLWYSPIKPYGPSGDTRKIVMLHKWACRARIAQQHANWAVRKAINVVQNINKSDENAACSR